MQGDMKSPEGQALDEIAQQIGYSGNDLTAKPPEHTEVYEGEELLANCTQVPFHKRAIPKAVLVGGGSLLALITLLIIYSRPLPRWANNANPSAQGNESTIDPKDEKLRAAQQEASQARAELALQSQQQQLARVSTRSVSRPPLPQRPPSPPPTIVMRRAPAPQSVTARPHRTFIPAPIPVAPPNPRPVAAPPTPVDPYHQWRALSRLGSYTGGSGQRTVMAAAPAFNSASSGERGVSGSPPNASSLGLDRLAPSPSAPLSSRRQGQPLSPGAKARARLMSPIVWSEDLKINSHTFLAELREGLGPALPAGTIIRMQPEEISQAGLIRFRAVGATINGQDQSLPQGIQVVGSNGSFIKARVRQQGGPSLATDLFGATLSGVSTAARLMNQPRTQTSFTNGTFSQTTTTNNTSLGMGFAQGATETLVNRLQSRTQQRRQQTPYFYVGAGTPVMLMVTQTVAL